MTKAKITPGMNPTREQAIEELRRMVLDALGDHDAAVWLFGSCARGDVRHPSDIDVAIFPRGDFPSGFLQSLAADIEESTIPYDVDLVDLEEPRSVTKCSEPQVARSRREAERRSWSQVATVRSAERTESAWRDSRQLRLPITIEKNSAVGYATSPLR